MDTRFTVSQDCFMRSLPTRVDPVKLIFFIRGFVQNSVPTAGVVSVLAVLQVNRILGAGLKHFDRRNQKQEIHQVSKRQVTKIQPISDQAKFVTHTNSNTPSGIPARSAKFFKAIAEIGVSSDGLATAVHPAAKAGPTFRVSIARGKFQGVTIAATPTACCIAMTCPLGPPLEPGKGQGTMKPPPAPVGCGYKNVRYRGND